MITKETFETAVTAIRDLEEAVHTIDRTLNIKADGTNWTTADSLSEIAYQLTRIADALTKEETL